jgi:hypothetical protein
LEDKISDPELAKIVLPIIKNVVPQIIAEELVSVQPINVFGPSKVETGYTEGIDNPYWVKMPRNITMTSVRGVEKYYDKSAEYQKWCSETFPKGDYVIIGVSYHFKYEKDRDWFVLRWT